jgi:hypothetical protein
MRWGQLPLGLGLWTVAVLVLASTFLPSLRAEPGQSIYSAPSAIHAARQGSFDFALIGDLGYGPDEEQPYANVLDELNAAPLAFVAHNGDLGNTAQGSCTDQHYARRLAQFQASAHPLIFTPGDNDWTDCHRPQAGSLNPTERLARVRQVFFPDDQSLGQRKIAVTRQSQNPAFSRFRENARWDYEGITFVTIHTVGSNDNLGRTEAMDAEWAERSAANVAWLRSSFEAARNAGSAAIMIITQANIFPEISPGAGNPRQNSGFVDVRATLATEALAFPKPVVVVHGDSHYFRIDKPLRGATTGTLENVTRVETFGSPNHHWLLASVDPSDPNVFVFRQRMVPANFVDHAPDLGRSWGP